MSPAAVFAVVGGIGLVIVVASLVLGDLFEGLFESLDIDVGGGLFSTPVIGSFLAAFGFGGALLLASTEAGPVAATATGVAAGVVMAAAALAVTRGLMRMATDESVRLGDMVGKPATVVSAIPAEGLGEVSLVHLGQRMKLNARSPSALPYGTEVVVVSVSSSSSVVVERATEFWGQPASLTEGD